VIDVPISAVRLGPEVEEKVLGVLRSGTLAQGPVVAELEAGFRSLVGTRHALAVNSGTTALVLALEALGVGPGDEVLTSPFTFAATLNAILERGATARFADIGDDFTIRPAQAEALLTGRTKAIVPVHLYGLPADMAALAALAGRAGIGVVEDAAQAHGATVGGRPAGSFGLGCFSLYATKNLTSGEGGVVTTDDDALADRMAVLRNQGMRERYRYELAGHNYRMTDLHAAVAVPQLARLAEATERRRRHAALLTAGLADLEELELPAPVPGRDHVWHQYTVRVRPASPLGRDALAEGLAARGIGTGTYYPRVVYDYDCYRSHPGVVCDPVPRAQEAARTVLSLPVHPHLVEGDVERVVAAVRAVVRGD
jgi:perosamine synthetase